MRTIETPKANPENLLDLIRDTYNGKIVVPEFQRSFVWSREDIEELFASILQGYFIGTFLMLDTPTATPMFPFRVVEGVKEVNPGADPERHQTVRLILDGQQRITSAFYALYAPEIPLRGSKFPYRFYLRLDVALEGNLDEAIEGVSERDTGKMAEIEQLVKKHMALPLQFLCDSNNFYNWLYTQSTWKGDEERQAIRIFHERLQRFNLSCHLSGFFGEED